MFSHSHPFHFGPEYVTTGRGENESERERERVEKKHKTNQVIELLKA